MITYKYQDDDPKLIRIMSFDTSNDNLSVSYIKDGVSKGIIFSIEDAIQKGIINIDKIEESITI